MAGPDQLKSIIPVLGRTVLDLLLRLFGLFSVQGLLASRNDRTPCIAFQAYSVHLAQFYEPVIRELLRAPRSVRLTFVILLHPHFPLRASRELKTFARTTLGLPESDIKFYWQILWRRFDLIVCADVFARFPRNARAWLLLHGPGLTERMFTPHALRKSVRDFDRILVTGEYDRRLTQTFRAETKNADWVVAAGSPFLDGIETLSVTRETYFKRLGLDPGKRTVLIGPSWRGLTLNREKGATYFDEVIATIGTADFNVVIKPHACSFNRVMAAGVDWRKRIERLAGRQDVYVDLDVDDRPALKYAHVLITDISSRAFAFMLLGKPVIQYFPAAVVLEPMDQKRLDLIRQGSLVASEPGEIAPLLVEVQRRGFSNDPASALATECFSNRGSSTQTIVRMMREAAGTGGS